MFKEFFIGIEFLIICAMLLVFSNIYQWYYTNDIEYVNSVLERIAFAIGCLLFLLII